MSTSPATSELASLSAPRKLLIASGLLLLINSFLAWYSASAFGVTFTQNGWNQLGTLVWIVLIATLVWEGVRIAGVAPIQGQRADLATAGLAGLTLVLGVIYLIVRLTDGSLGFAFWLGLLLFVVFGFAIAQLFQASGGQAAVREVQAEAAQRRAQQQAQQPQQPSASTPTQQQPPVGQQPPAQQPPASNPQDPPASA